MWRIGTPITKGVLNMQKQYNSDISGCMEKFKEFWYHIARNRIFVVKWHQGKEKNAEQCAGDYCPEI